MDTINAELLKQRLVDVADSVREKTNTSNKMNLIEMKALVDSISLSNIENYDGEYDVIPSVDQQILGTKNKYMIKDVTIREIPFYSVSNSSNGETIIIGGNIDGY